MKLTEEQLKQLSAKDRSEIGKFKRYLKLKATRWGRNILKTQQYWKDYQGI